MEQSFNIVNNEIFNEQLQAHGRVVGVAYYDKELHGMFFKAYNRKAVKRRRKTDLLHQLENGWVRRKSTNCISVSIRNWGWRASSTS